MDCKYFRDLLSAYIDGYINEKEKREIEEHILHCEKCESYFEELKKSIEILRNFEKVEAPIGFEKKVLEKIKEKKFNWFFNKKLLIEFAVGIFAFVSIFFVYLNLSKSKEEIGPQIIGEEKNVKYKKEEVAKKEEKLDEKRQKISKEELKMIEEKAKPKEIRKETSSKIEVKKEKSKIESLRKMDLGKKEESKKEKLLKKEPEKDKNYVEEQAKVDIIPKNLDGRFEEKVLLKEVNIKVFPYEFEEVINKIEKILKNENIKYGIIKDEKSAQIMISFNDFKILIEKIKFFEWIKIEEYSPEEIKENERIEIKITPDKK